MKHRHLVLTTGAHRFGAFFKIIDRTTGKVRGFATSHAIACEKAAQLDKQL